MLVSCRPYPMDPKAALLRFQVRTRPNWFTIGYGKEKVTVYSQQVRALNLAWALRRSEGHRDGPFVVIGGGAAGLTVAAGLAQSGAEVTVLEKEAVVMPLQYHCYKRHLHPHVFEWPDEKADNPFADLPLLNWKAGTAREVALTIEAAFEEQRHQNWPRLDLQTGVRDIELDFPTRGVLTYRVGTEPRKSNYGTLVLALGFGVEDTFWAGPRGSYWADDSLDQHGVFQGRYLVSGAGDGGLIDVLRILLRDMRQQDLARKVSALPTFAELRRCLDDIEKLWRSGAAGIEREVYAAYEDLGTSGVLSPLDEILDRQINRDVRVTLATRSSPFSRKSRPLHRLLVSRLHFKYRDLFRIRTLELTEGDLIRDGSKARLYGETFDHVVIRHSSKENPMVHFPAVYEALCDHGPPPGVDEPIYEVEHFECHDQKGAAIEWSGGPDIEDYLDMLGRKVKQITPVSGSRVRTASLKNLHCEIREPSAPPDDSLPLEDDNTAIDREEEDRRIFEAEHEQHERRTKVEFDQVRKDRSWRRIPGLAVPMGDFDTRLATIVTGRVGTGKTTYLTVAADEALEKYRHDRKEPLPVWIDGYIDEFSEEKVLEDDVWAQSLADAAVRSMELPTYSGAASTIRSKIRRNEAVLFLDGVDTWPAEALRLTLKWITTRRLGALVATRCLPVDVDVSALAGVMVIEILGLSVDSALPFVRINTDHDRVIEDVTALIRDREWELTPFLLGAAINLSSAGELNLARFDMLRFYEQLIDQALLHEEKRSKILDALQRRARHDLRRSPPEVLFHRKSLPLELRKLVLRTHLVSGHGLIEFSHLSLGEYLASAPPIDLAAERERMLKDEPDTSWRHALEVLPMAHARDASALPDLWSDMGFDDPEHFVLGLLLRAIAYGGSAVEGFCAQRSTDVLGEVVKRISRPSARFSEPEFRLTRDLHRAKRFLHGAEINSSTLPMYGRPGAEAWSLAAAFGAPENTPHYDSNLWSTAFHQAEQLLSRGPEEVWRDTRGGDMFRRPRASVLLRDKRRLRDMLASQLPHTRKWAISEKVGSTLFAGLLSDPDPEVRARAVSAQDEGFWTESSKQDILQWIFEHDLSPHVQRAALEWLEPGRSLEHSLARLTRSLVERKRVTHSEQRLLSLLLRRVRDDERVVAFVDEFLASGKGWYLEEEIIRELCEGDDDRTEILNRRIRSPRPSLSEITAAEGITTLEPALRDVLKRFLKDSTLVQQASVAIRSLPHHDGPSRSDRLRILQRPKPWDSATTILLTDAINSFKGDEEAISEVLPFLKQLEDSSLASAAIETIGHRPEFWPLVFQQLREGKHNARLAAAKLLVKIPDVAEELWAYFRTLSKTDSLIHLDSHLRAIILEARARNGDESLLFDYIDDPATPVRGVALNALLENPIAESRLRKRVLKEQDHNLQAVLWAKFVDMPEVQERLDIDAREDLWAVRYAYFALCLRDESLRAQLVEFVDSLINEGESSECAPMLPELIAVMASDSSVVHHLGELFFKHADLRVRGTVLQKLRRDAGLRKRIREQLDAPNWSDMFEFGITSAFDRYFQGDTESIEKIFERLRECPEDTYVAWVLPLLRGYMPARDLLRQYKSSDEINTKRAAFEALRDQLEERQELIDALRNGDRSTKVWAADLLEDVASDDAQYALAKQLDDQVPELRRSALKAHRRLRRLIPNFRNRWLAEVDVQTRCLLMEVHASSAGSEVVADDFRSLVGSETSERARSIACSVLRRAEPVEYSLREYLSQAATLDEECLVDYLRNPRILHYADSPSLWVEIERWLMAKLVSTLPVHLSMEEAEVYVDRSEEIFGEFIGEPQQGQIRLAMDPAVLPRDRNIWPAANVVHAWRVASRLRSKDPKTLCLACADLASEELRFPDLVPGELSLGPVYFGFRIQEEA